MRSDGLLDPKLIDSALSMLLDRHPEAAVCALGPDGLMVEMPGSVPLAGHRVVRDRSTVNLVTAGDRGVVINAWERARAVGAARALVRLASDSSRPVALYLIDGRRSHGVYLGVVVDAVGDDSAVFDPETPSVAPRFVRSGKSVVEVSAELLRSRERVLARLAETVPVGVVHIDGMGRVVYANQRLQDILGCPRAGSLDDVLSTVVDRDREMARRALEGVLRDGVDDDIDVIVRPAWADGSGDGYGDDSGETLVRQCRLNLRGLSDDDGDVTGVIVCVEDVTANGGSRDGRQLRATFDVLTRCHNRDSTIGALEAMLAGALDGTSPGVILVDLYRFKELNDGHGHDVGDEFLGVVARRLRGAVREDDVVGRIGGDQFLVLCPGIATSAEAVRTAIRVAETLGHEIQLKDLRVGSRASIGVAWSSGSEIEAEALVARAGVAMDESKRRGGGRPVLYTASLPGAGSHDAR
ncbi:MAG TPA: diguanylate cyclase [Acidimicrobiales bacterium]|nr:diguanylate cyclase [Acidimicrobiales bacterium]